jgi:NAD(P)-dependent dehydrogenase (short-subunit alcohol dehydrogenase family)
LGEAGAIVYITGRTEHSQETTVPLPGTIRETAQSVTEFGGVGIAVQCDHRHDDEVEALFNRVKTEYGRLDILVNNVWGGYQNIQRGQPGFQTAFWKMPPAFWDSMHTVGVRSHYVCSVFAARLMVTQKSGLIANISSYAGSKYTSNVAYGVAKAAVDRMAIDMAFELRRFNVAAVSIWPGVVTTEMFLKRRQGKSGKWPKVESPRFVGQAIVALATDPNVMAKTGKILPTRELAREYGFTDLSLNTAVKLFDR